MSLADPRFGNPSFQYKNNVILLEDLDFSMDKKELNEITALHNAGWDYRKIAKKVKRNKFEIIIALLHQVKKGKPMRPFAALLKEETI
ncbi:hypothetical protein ACFSMW_06755 [Virgibacillus halophilus]|uniref:hypothetical protein n=1 Tax=Tigheibacillus halophilus TaxID=361280 RepID=UPI00362E259A